jgi:hypothetical protein
MGNCRPVAKSRHSLLRQIFCSLIIEIWIMVIQNHLEPRNDVNISRQDIESQGHKSEYLKTVYKR